MWLGAVHEQRLGGPWTGEFLADDDQTIECTGVDSQEEAAVTPRPSV